MAFIIFLPVIAAIIGIIIALFCFIGTCLIIMGGTGIVMDKMYLKQMKTTNGLSRPIFNKSSILLGIIFILFPLGYVLSDIISSLSSK
jgi:TRAP-type C4-dicarboxylate transport system permease small subunit